MKTNQWIGTGIALALVALVGAMGMAEEEQGNRRHGEKGSAEMRRFRKEQHAARREHGKSQLEENRAFRETLEDKQPNEACGEIVGHRQQQFSENKTFFDGQHEAFVAFMTKLMQQNEVPAEKQAERLAQMNEHYTEATERHEERQKEIIATLQELSGKEDLTWEELKEAMEQFRRREGRESRGGREGGERRRGHRRSHGPQEPAEGV